MPAPARPWSSTSRACSTMSAPRKARRGGRAMNHMLDYSAWFVMPGLVDVHTHLAYGNAKGEEDIDLYSPLEFRTLRGMFFAQKVAAAGFTAICFAGRRRADQPLDPQCDPRRPLRRPAGHGSRALCDDPPGSDRLVPDLDRRPRDLDRQARDDECRGGRGDPPPGQGRGRLHQDRTRRHPAAARMASSSPPSPRTRPRSWCARPTVSAKRRSPMPAAARPPSTPPAVVWI